LGEVGLARINLSRSNKEEKPDENIAGDVRVETAPYSDVNNHQEREFSSAIHYLPQGICIIDTCYNIRYVNPAFIKLTGIEAEKAVGKKCYEVFRSSLCHTDGCRLVKILNGGEATETEIERENDCGGRVPYMVSAFPMHDEDNNIIAIMESFRDLTSMKMLEDRVKEAEERYKAIVELTGEVGEGIMTLEDVNGREGVITFASQQCVRMTGYSSEELLEKTFFELLSEDDRLPALDRHRRKIRGESLPGLYEMEIIRKDGKRTPVELTSALTLHKGKSANVAYIRDISERKKIEGKLKEYHHTLESEVQTKTQELKKLNESLRNEIKKQKITEKKIAEKNIELQRILDAIPASIYVEDRETRYTLLNKQAVEIIGINEDQLIGKTVLDFFPTLMRHYKIDKRIIKSGRSVKNIIETREKQGVQRWSKVDKTPYRDSNGKVKGLVCTATDITALKVMEARLKSLINKERDLRKQLEKTNESRVKYTRMLVHELKTPLTPMVSATEILVQKSEGELGAISRNLYEGVVSLNKRVDELLDIARGELNILSLEKREVNIIEIIYKVLEKMHYLFSSRKQTITFHPPGHPIIGFVDPDRIEQVIINLLDNASKFTDDYGSIFIRIRKRNNIVSIEIEDSGLGVSDDEIDEIFKPYYAPTKVFTPRSGLGIGLTLSKMLVDLHGGSIGLRKAQEQGSIFYLALPLNSRG
jgi:PAS domain S-box-containing protein